MSRSGPRFRLPLLVLLAVLAWAAAVRPAHAARPIDHRPLTLVLRDHVRDGRVDYLGIRETRWAGLNAYLDSMAAVDPLEHRGHNRLAFYINLYNATVIHAVIERLHAGYSVAENHHALFDEPLVRMNGRHISLNQLEHEHIRTEFPDPRIHTALVCAAVSCPPLLPRAYDRIDLEHTLSVNMQRFLSDTTRNRVDPGAKKLWLSQIFNWYAQDFQTHGGVRAYVDSILPADVSGDAIGFLDYDWSLNIAQPRGEWVATRAESVPLRGTPGGAAVATAHEGDLFRVVESREDAWRVSRPFGAGEAWLAKDDAAIWQVH